MRRIFRRTRSIVVATALLAVFGLPAGPAAASAPVGAVYTITNDPAGNAVAVFDRAADGSLTPAGEFATDGLGTGGGLGNQGALAMRGRVLYVVNAGSDEISAFHVRRSGLTLIDTVASGGARPVSLTVHNQLLYVLNAGTDGSPGNITGFRLGADGSPSPIAGSTRPLSDDLVGPAQIQFDPSGNVLVVTEKATNLITTYTVNSLGFAGAPATQASSGDTPFGFAFDRRGNLIVSEAFGGAASALSSYGVEGDGSLDVISASVEAGEERASCWVAITPNGRYAYTTNTASGSVSGYRIAPDGSLSLLDGDGITAETGGSPIDASTSRDGGFLYVLNSGLNSIQAFTINQGGSLTALPSAGLDGLPVGTNGLLAR